MSDRPHKAGQFTGYGDADLVDLSEHGRQPLHALLGAMRSELLFGQGDAVAVVLEVLFGDPVFVTLGPSRLPGYRRPWRSKNACSCWRAFSRMPTAFSRARYRLRIASCASSGTQIALRSPARDSSANRTQSRRSFLTRSPGRRGINDGATI